MHYIFPAAQLARELQDRMQQYFKQFDNPVVNHHAPRLMATNRHEQLVQQALQLAARINHLRFMLSGAARHYFRQSLLGVEASTTHAERLARHWDELAIYPAPPAAQLRTQPIAWLESYLGDAGPVVERLERAGRLHSRLPKPSQTSPTTPLLATNLCERLVRAVLFDELASQFKWLPTPLSSRVDQCLQEVFPEWKLIAEDNHDLNPPDNWRDAPESACLHFSSHVLAPIERVIAGWVGSLIPESTWSMWSIRALGHDLMVQEGEDWRIWDWERRMQTGEWSQADSVKAFLDTQYEAIQEQSGHEIDQARSQESSLRELGLSNPTPVPGHTLVVRKAPQLIRAGKKATP